MEELTNGLNVLVPQQPSAELRAALKTRTKKTLHWN